MGSVVDGRGVLCSVAASRERGGSFRRNGDGGGGGGGRKEEEGWVRARANNFKSLV